MGKPLTAAQEKIRDEQVNKNNDYLEKIDSLLEEIEPFCEQTKRYKTCLFDIYEGLNNAHGMIFQGIYADLYTMHLGKPTTAAFTIDGISDEFSILGDETKEELLEELPNKENYQQKLDGYFKLIKSLVNDVSAENSMIIRFEGLDNLFLELKQVSENNWTYTSQRVKNEVLNNREIIKPLHLHGMQMVYPFHISMYLSYSPMFNTALLLKNKLEEIKRIIKSINVHLPFVELTEKLPQIQNIVTGLDSSVSIGEHVSIGSENAFGDNASVGRN